MFNLTKVEKTEPLHKPTFDEFIFVHKRFIRLKRSSFSCDTEVVHHGPYTGLV